jgi:hypothetical protein
MFAMRWTVLPLLAISLMAASVARADDFYKGKTVTIIVRCSSPSRRTGR